ncbi:unnamed protein product [Oppiella nova]|uniref:RING-CH-type domain-containing protein n=1 Tax=Oppiella nova TaxID=334625 RepID=A0A7R9MEX3_9ACAR|nr:unnamed protein product [Oppiella nova]CAG2175738.1 unnamed protein product [Oppiella nova]
MRWRESCRERAGEGLYQCSATSAQLYSEFHDESSRIPSSLCRYVSEECAERAVPTTSASMSVPSYAVVDDESPVCRICHCNDDNEFVSVDDDATTGRPSTPTTTLITPCFCSGSLRFVHHYCLQQWIRSSNHKYCELCKFHFKLTVKSKPLLKWQSLDMTSGERRKLVCNLVFNVISMFCVFWSIYVLIERATVEARYGLLDWPFWTKMLVVTIGLLGGTVFLFVQLRLYVSILLRWRQFNRIFLIENAPHTPALNQPTIATIAAHVTTK